MKSAVLKSAKNNFEANGAREKFKDLHFGMLTMRTPFVYTFCSTCHLHNIREMNKNISNSRAVR